ncbi:thiamine pyrophosphate-dependent enzyme [Castellaniella sp.]|uniref:thiamine pyrophosphate-dependent enzyme n=1 Tax=Castellaniella sp. TaxID=1955812 RepID=UPI003A94DCF9
MSKHVSEIIVDALIEAGAQRCYGVVGDTINHFTDAIRRSDLRWVHVRHEEAGALAAGGEAYMTGRLAVCAGTCGPGSLHFVNGIFESHRNGAPVLLIASDVASTEAGLDFPQEVDQRRIYEQASVFCEYMSHPSQARRLTALAAQTALSLRGVAVLIVRGDMFSQTDEDTLLWAAHPRIVRALPAPEELQQLADTLNTASSITLYAGYGARNARQQVLKLAQQLNAPVVHTSRAKEFIEPDNPYGVGMTGILGNQAGLEAIDRADLTLCLGTDFAWTQFYPQQPHVIQIDSDPAHLGRRAPIQMGLVGDIGLTVEALLPLLQPGKQNDHLEAARQQWLEDQSAYQKSGEEKDPSLLHPQFVTQTLDRLASEDAVFTADGGSPMVWLLRHLVARGKRRFLTSLLHGTMANAYPQAMGIAAAYPHRQVVALCGDGGLTMLMGDLLTLRQENLSVKLLVYNNASLGFVEMEQRVEGLLDSYTHLLNPDFVKLAEACGFPAWQVTRKEQLEPAMQQWLDTDGPALLDVHVSRMELVMPPKVQASQIASTALFGLKAVFSGRATEVVSLLRDNFLR